MAFDSSTSILECKLAELLWMILVWKSLKQYISQQKSVHVSVYRRSSFKEGFVWGNPSIKVDFKAWNRSRRWDSCQIFFLNLQKQKRFSVIKNPGFIWSTSRGVFCTPVFQILCMPKNDCLTLHCRAFLFLLLSSLTSLQFRLSTIFKICIII